MLCFFATVVMEGCGIYLTGVLGLHYVQSPYFHLWQPLTYMFMHGGWAHLFFNMFALWMFGGVIESTFGSRRFLVYYVVCGLGAALCQELSQFVALMAGDYASVAAPTVGASGAIYGILLAFGMMYPEERLFVFPLPVPLKAKWFVMIYVVIELFSALSMPGDGVAHVAHLGGMLFGFLLIRHWRRYSSSFNGWDGYEVKESRASSILGRIRQWFENIFKSTKDNLGNRRSDKTSKHQQDWDYNAQQRKKEKEEEKEMDRILDKIRRSGYGALTDEEKRKLFDRK